MQYHSNSKNPLRALPRAWMSNMAPDGMKDCAPAPDTIQLPLLQRQQREQCAHHGELHGRDRPVSPRLRPPVCSSAQPVGKGGKYHDLPNHHHNLNPISHIQRDQGIWAEGRGHCLYQA
eukprot:10094599-Ditylum_brightwellii.AAC.1